MKLLDLNVLLYAVNSADPHHRVARDWLDRALTGAESVAIPSVVLTGFLRLATSPRVFPRPLSVEQAVSVVDAWLGMPAVVTLSPGDGHWPILRGVLRQSSAGTALITDAHLAAMAMEHGAELCSTDGDFARFRGLRWSNPLV